MTALLVAVVRVEGKSPFQVEVAEFWGRPVESLTNRIKDFEGLGRSFVGAASVLGSPQKSGLAVLQTKTDSTELTGEGHAVSLL